MLTQRPKFNLRPALSTLEIVGCLFALAGGIWLGAVYLGIDLQRLGYTALVDSNLLEKVPEQWRPTEPNLPEGALTPEQSAAEAQRELTSLGREIAEPNSQAQRAENAETTHGNLSDASAATSESKVATLEYWNALRELVQNEAALQLQAESKSAQDRATELAALKARISRLTATALRGLPTKNVDPAAVAFGDELTGWYEKGADILDQVVLIWESTAGGQTNQHVTAEWDRSKRQHANERQLLDGRSSAVRDSLIRRYGESFGDISW